MSDHALLAPSAAVRWVPCPGSVQLEAAFPEIEESEASREGTAAHWVLSELLKGNDALKEGDVAPNGYVLSEEMFVGAAMMLDDVDSMLRNYPGAITGLHCEQRIDIFNIHPLNWGTPDLWIYIPGAHVVILWDYKFGYGRVNVFSNWQLLNYMAGILSALKINGLDDQNLTVIFKIVQPRCYTREGPIREWKTTGAELRGYFNLLKASAYESQTKNARTQTGEHCLNCRGRHACDAFLRSVSKALDYVGEAQPLPLDDFSLGIELTIVEDAFNRISSYVEALRSDAENRIRTGRAVENWCLINTYGRKKWAAKPEEVAALGDLFGVELRKPIDVITPTQALALKTLDAGVISSYIEPAKTSLKLTKSENSLALAAFKKVEN